MLAFAETYKLDIAVPCNQLEIAMIMLKQRNEEIVEVSSKGFGESHGAIPEAMRLYKITQTVQVASASTERFLKVLNE